jgi:hypothetical protein
MHLSPFEFTDGTARSTAFAVRLQAWPAPVTCLPAALEGSMGHGCGSFSVSSVVVFHAASASAW